MKDRSEQISRPRRRSVRARFRAYRRKRKREDRPMPEAVVPSFFTLMNLFSGFLAVIQVYNQQYDYAAWLIVLAGFFDFLDGLMARLTDTVSPFGVELDSLSDVVSFGLAPAFLVYAFGLYQLSTVGMIVASLPVVCGAVRLARYNVLFEHEKKSYFDGLPTPVQALTLVAFILTFHDRTWLAQLEWGNLSVLVPLVVLLSALMISTVEFQSIPKPTRAFLRDHPRTALAYGLAIVLVLILQETGLFISLVVYIFINVGKAIYETGRESFTSSTMLT